MHVTYWGVRGSCPVPGPRTVRYGGNTPCTEIRASDGTLLILDAGTGIRPLGKLLTAAESGEDGLTAHLLLSHTHHDHIHGLPFFEPIYNSSNRVNIYGPQLPDVSLEEVVAGWMGQAYHPTPLEDLHADVQFVAFEGGSSMEIGPFKIHAATVNHTSITNAYRIESEGLAVAYVTDTGPYDGPLLLPAGVPRVGSDEEMVKSLRDGLVDLIQGCRLVLFDAMFTDAELHERPTWGHSSATVALEICRDAGIGHLVMIHHGPDADDDEMDLRVARARAQANGMMVSAAREGETLVLR